MIDAGKE